MSAIFDTLAMFPSQSLVDTVATEEDIPRSAVARLMDRAQRLPRGPWLERLAQEYVFARILSQRESAKTLAFFERQLLVEILGSAPRRQTPSQRPAPEHFAPQEGDTVTARAVRYIEANLFSPLSLITIARHAFASPSTLLRHFRHDTGKSPHAYVKIRRLEEECHLLEVGTHAVGDVALLVGYESFAAFTSAFTRHYGVPPSTVRQRARPHPLR